MLHTRLLLLDFFFFLMFYIQWIFINFIIYNALKGPIVWFFTPTFWKDWMEMLGLPVQDQSLSFLGFEDLAWVFKESSGDVKV